jgi:uncharacterized damage-inducible protein DinB
VTPLVFRQLFAYDRWASRRLLDAAARLPPGLATRDLGPPWSRPSLAALLAQLLGDRRRWLARLGGEAPGGEADEAETGDLGALRERWSAVEAGWQVLVDGLGETDLARWVDYRQADGTAVRLPLWVLLQHVANQGTHERSEAAAMISLLQEPPPPMELLRYHLVQSGQGAEP